LTNSINLDASDGFCEVLAIAQGSGICKLLLTMRDSSIKWKSIAMVCGLRSICCEQVLLLYVRHPTDRAHRTEELHVSCVAALAAWVKGLVAWMGKMPAVAVMAQC
jgi:hypothetical protein